MEVLASFKKASVFSLSLIHILEEVYHQVRVMTKEQISERYQLSENQAEILYFSLAICRHLLDCTLAKRILCPKVELWDALVRQLLFSKCKGAYDDQVRENAISCALQMVEHYGASRAHDLDVYKRQSILTAGDAKTQCCSGLPSSGSARWRTLRRTR